MKNDIHASGMTRSWLQAWNMRCCPPDTIWEEDSSPEHRQHLKICPFCRQDREEPLAPIRLDLPVEDTSQKSEPRIGELRPLSLSLAGWGPKSRYYTPPVVLVIDLPDEQAVHVVQTFGDPILAGPDDILFDNDLVGFAEPWNRYTVRVGDLGDALGTVSDDCLLRVKEVMNNPAPPLQIGSLLWFFRQMEIETGWYFARQSIAGLLESTAKTSQFTFADIPTDRMLEDLEQLPVIMPDIDGTPLPEDILARTMPADALLPMAAAELKPHSIRILLFVVERNRIRTAELIPGDVTLMDRKESTLNISGCCRADIPDDASWVFRWQSREWSVQPLPGQYGASEGVFWAVFPITEITNPEQGELIVRILVQR